MFRSSNSPVKNGVGFGSFTSFSRFLSYIIRVDHCRDSTQPEDHWSCIAHLSAEDMLKSVVTEEKFKRSPWARADNPLVPKF